VPNAIFLEFSKRFPILKRSSKLFTLKGRFISGGSVEWQFSPEVYISLARTALRFPSSTHPKSLLSSGAL